MMLTGVHGMGNIGLILLVFAFVLTLIAGFQRGAPGPGGWWFPHLGWIGMALYFLSLLLR
jgi:hypothetical protein